MVTGGAGFIGSALVRYLVHDKGLSVLNVDKLTYAACLQSGGEMGWSLFIAVPVCFGAILGYACRVQTWAFAVLGILVIASVVFALISMNLAGIFCGFALGIIFLIPTFAGLMCGVILRMFLIAGTSSAAALDFTT